MMMMMKLTMTMLMSFVNFVDIYRVQPKFINALCEKIDTNTSAFLVLQVQLLRLLIVVG